jgi:thiol:disulfide interchange protein DsbD
MEFASFRKLMKSGASSLLLFTLMFVVSVIGSTSAHAEDAEVAPLKAQARFEMLKADAKEGTVIVEIQLVEPYKAYADRFKLVVEEPADATLEPFQLTPIVQFMDTFTKKMKDGIKHQGTMTAKLSLKSADPKALKLKLTYQACTTEHCLFPKNVALTPTIMLKSSVAEGPGSDKPSHREPAAETESTTAAAGGGSTEFEKALSGGLLSAVLFMVVAGFLTSLTPCIYPMIPITLAILGASDRRTGVRKQGEGPSKFRSFFISVIYVLGIATTYSILGVTAASTGALFGSALSNVYVVSVLAVLFVIMGLSMYGLFEIQAPAFIRDRMGQGKSQAGYAGAYFTGLAAGVVASPCIGPVLVSVLAYIAQTQDKMLGLVLLFSFAMGMGVLFIALGTSSFLLDKVPKAGSWMDGVKFIFGTTMIAMAIYYVAPVYPDWAVRALVGIAMV